jgi:hypothetical protein
MVGIMLWVDWQLALIALAPLPLLWLSTVKFGRRIQTVSRKTRVTEGQMAATASEALAGIRTVQALGLEAGMQQSFAGANDAALTQDVKAKRLAAGLERLVDLLLAGAIALVLYFGARSVMDGRITPGRPSGLHHLPEEHLPPGARLREVLGPAGQGDGGGRTGGGPAPDAIHPARPPRRPALAVPGGRSPSRTCASAMAGNRCSTGFRSRFRRASPWR